MTNHLPKPPVMKSLRNYNVDTPTQALDLADIPVSKKATVEAAPDVDSGNATKQDALDAWKTDGGATAADVEAEAGVTADGTEVTAAAGTALEGAAETTAENTSEEGVTYQGDIYGGPWEIIKHVGIGYTLLWALGAAAVTLVTAYLFAPFVAFVPLTVLGFFMGVIAAVDSKTHLIKNRHTIITAVVAGLVTVFYVFSVPGPMMLLSGLGAAVIIFLTFIGLVMFTGFGSGGDIKFAPVPAFVLGCVNFILPMLWMFISLIVTMVILVVGKKKEVPFGVGMMISLPITIAATYGLYQLMGLPYAV